jgi:iron(III) transport system permease protein
LILLVGIPLGTLCYKAGGQVVLSEAGSVQSWSPAKCALTVATSPWRYRREFGWSLVLAAFAATAAIVAGGMLAWFARRGRLRMAAMLSICAVGLSLPGPIVGLALIRLLDRPDCRLLEYLYDQSILAPWLALAIRGLAPATLILWHALRTVPQELLDAAAVDGAGRWRRFRAIALRNRLPAVGLAWLVVLALSLGDLAATILVVPPGLRTLSVRIFDLLHSGIEDRVAGICLAVVLVLAAVAAAAGRLARKWGRGA